MKVIPVSLIDKAMRSLRLGKKDVVNSREGPGWIVIVTVFGKKYLYYQAGSDFPKGNYQKIIKARRRK